MSTTNTTNSPKALNNQYFENSPLFRKKLLALSPTDRTETRRLQLEIGQALEKNPEIDPNFKNLHEILNVFLSNQFLNPPIYEEITAGSLLRAHDFDVIRDQSIQDGRRLLLKEIQNKSTDFSAMLAELPKILLSIQQETQSLRLKKIAQALSPDHEQTVFTNLCTLFKAASDLDEDYRRFLILLKTNLLSIYQFDFHSCPILKDYLNIHVFDPTIFDHQISQIPSYLEDFLNTLLNIASLLDPDFGTACTTFRDKCIIGRDRAWEKGFSFLVNSLVEKLSGPAAWIRQNPEAIVSLFTKNDLADFPSGMCLQNALDRHLMLMKNPTIASNEIPQGATLRGKIARIKLNHDSNFYDKLFPSVSLTTIQKPNRTVPLNNLMKTLFAEQKVLCILTLFGTDIGHAINVQIDNEHQIFRLIDDKVGIVEFKTLADFKAELPSYLKIFSPACSSSGFYLTFQPSTKIDDKVGIVGFKTLSDFKAKILSYLKIFNPAS